MKKGSIKKIVLIAAVFCILGTAAAIAAGKTVYWVSSRSADNPDYTQFSQLSSASEELGFSIHALENFDNGFSFKSADIVTIQGKDEQNNDTLSFPELYMDYKDSTNASLTVSAQKVLEELKSDSENFDSTKEINGIQVGYNVDKYKFLPPDATPSQEDLDAEARGELFISYGSQEEQVEYFTSAVWEQDGVKYLILTSQKQLSADEMFSMAEQMITAP